MLVRRLYFNIVNSADAGLPSKDRTGPNCRVLEDTRDQNCAEAIQNPGLGNCRLRRWSGKFEFSVSLKYSSLMFGLRHSG